MKHKSNFVQTTNFGLLLLLLPVVFGVLTFYYGPLFPFDGLSFLRVALPFSLIAFFIIWLLSFWNRFQKRGVFILTAFFLMLWLITRIPFLGTINSAWDQPGEPVLKSAKVVAIKEIKASTGIRGSSKGSCLVTFEEEIEGLIQKGIRRDYCETLQPEKDRIQFSLRPGLFGSAWVADIVILRGP